MAEIFISYKSERRKAAAHLAKILERCGYTVCYDYSLVKGRRHNPPYRNNNACRIR